MAKVERSIRLIGRTAGDLDSISGAPGEIFLDSSSQTLRVYDGNTLGGSNLGGSGSGLNTEQVQDITAGLFNTSHNGVTVSYNDGAASLTLTVSNQTWSQITGKPTFATVATTGSYTDLTNQPTIPTNTNQLTNGAGYVTSTGIASQTGNSGKYLTTDGSTTSWGTITITAASVGLGNVTNESKATMFASPTFTGTVAGVTATHVGLGNVTNESKATMFANPAFTGTVSAFLSSTHTLTASSNLVFTGSTSGTVTFQAGATPQVQTYTLPVAYPASSGYALVSTTGGVLTWTSVAGSLAALTGVTITSPTAGQVLKYNGSLWINDVDATAGGAGVGTVTTVSVVSVNGFTGTVATASSTPAITITTSITGVLKGNGTAISAAVGGVDYAPGTSALATGIVKSTTTTGALTIAVSGTDYQAPIGTITGLVKGNGANALTAAIAGTDYQTAQSVTGIVKSSGTTRSAATSGTDYSPGTSALATGIVKSTTTTGALSIAVSGTDYQAPLPTQTGQTGKYLTTDGTTLYWGTVSSGVGTVTSASVVSANGFTGTVANATSTPAITITTSITGVLKGNGTAISAATAGTDYQAPVSATGILKSSGVSGNVSAATAGTDYQAPVSATGILKSSGVSGNVSAAVAGTDYQSAQSVTGIVKSSGTTRSAAIAGTDYQAPITFTTTGSSGAATFNGTALNIPQYASGATAFTGLSDVSSASLTVDEIYLPAITQLVVTTPVFNYNIDQYSGDNPAIYATSGTTISFNLQVSGSHPFLLQQNNSNITTANLIHVSTSGVVSTGSSAQGKTSGTLYWKIPASVSGTFRYICQNHGSMVGTITISPPAITRTAVNGVTASLANAATGNLTITGYKGYALYKIQTSAAAWVRIYTDTASRSADAGRNELTDPNPGSGVIAEVITTGAETILISPGAMGFSNESTPSTNIELAVTNKSGGTTTITVTLTVLPLEV